MHIQCLPVGQLGTNCYVVSDSGSGLCAVIDPGDESNTIMDYLEQVGLKCTYILLTHGHYDHWLAAAAIISETGASVYIHPADTGGTGRFAFPEVSDITFCREGDIIRVGDLEFVVMETPGHSPGSVTYKCGGALFTGDTLFRGSCGRTDLPGGDTDTIFRSLARLNRLDGDYEVYPGHERSTDLARERRFNPYIKKAAELSKGGDI